MTVLEMMERANTRETKKQIAYKKRYLPMKSEKEFYNKFDHNIKNENYFLNYFI